MSKELKEDVNRNLDFIINREVRINEALSYFENYLDSTDNDEANKFFEKYAPGLGYFYNPKTKKSDALFPSENFLFYEKLLISLQRADHKKYKEMHKGTSFYMMAWISFYLRNYDQALFYLDSAISEDIKNTGKNWANLPASKFMMLDTQEHVAEQITKEIKFQLNAVIRDFNKNNSLNILLEFESLKERFLHALLHDIEKRNILTTLYVFIHEFPHRKTELHLRSTEGGSTSQFISHLFKGGLIFESLLKAFYPHKDDGDECNTIGDIIRRNSQFTTDFRNLPSIHSNSLQNIINNAIDNSLLTCFTTICRIRNTTGHRLNWDDIFNLNNYELLFQQEIFAIFYFAYEKYIR